MSILSGLLHKGDDEHTAKAKADKKARRRQKKQAGRAQNRRHEKLTVYYVGDNSFRTIGKGVFLCLKTPV
jgi:hypothetical protein